MSGEKFADFWHHRPSGQFVFEPTRDLWPASSVDAAIDPFPVVKNGVPVLKSNGEPKTIAASRVIAKQRPVQNMVWAAGEPTIIRDRLLTDGGWITRNGAACFNLYRPAPTFSGGD